MKRVAVNLACSLLTFTCGLAVNAVWNSNKTRVRVEQSKVVQVPISNDDSSASPASTNIPFSSPTPDREVVFGQGRLRMVPKEVHLKSERLQYEIDVSYPQIVGSDALHIRKLNQRIKELATERYQWPLNPSKGGLTILPREVARGLQLRRSRI